MLVSEYACICPGVARRKDNKISKLVNLYGCSIGDSIRMKGRMVYI